MGAGAFFTIPPGNAFATELVRGLMSEADTPQTLAKTLILVPTRRAKRALSSAFLSQSKGKAMLLPQIKAIGDLDDDAVGDALISDEGDLPPAIPQMRRLCLIAKQVQRFPIGGTLPSEVQAFALAHSLISLFDQMQNAEFDVEQLEALWPQELATHWQDIAQFMTIMTRFWPHILEEEQAIDPVMRRRLLMDRQIALWQKNPPQTPVIIAGSTGTLIATQRLMKAVASLPKGRIVFPGLIPDIADDDWQIIQEDRVHPLHPLSVTFKALNITLSDVAIWPASQARQDAHKKRWQFLQEVMRPASQTEKWRALGSQQDSFIDKQSFAGFRRLEAQDSHEEAQIIALLLRAQLEVPERTAILITPDRQLAQMVRAALRQFHIEIDDSAGEPLSSTMVGNYIYLLAKLVDSRDIITDIVRFASHPFCSAGLERQNFRQTFDAFHTKHLRGTLRFDDLDGLVAYLAEVDEPAAAFFKTHIEDKLAPLLELGKAQDISLAEAARIMGRVAEDMAATSDEEAALAEAVNRLWSGVDGEAAGHLLGDIAQHGHDFMMRPFMLADSLQNLMKTIEVRRPYQRQSRLAILGAVESRMLSADMVILSGLNEGVWPPKPAHDLWMNQQMAAEIGLPHRQWRIALSAHDFMMAAAQPDVVITRARRQNDRPTLASRWLVRMDAVMKAAKIEDLVGAKMPEDIAQILQAQKAVLPQPISPPAPRPPVAQRPDRVSATQFDKLISDPYGFYADKILRLKKLRPLNEPPGPLLKGNLFHEALQLFVAAYPQRRLVPKDAKMFLEIAEPLFAPWMHHQEVAYVWWSQLEKIANWFVDYDNQHRDTQQMSYVETKAEIKQSIGARDITITAKADRIITNADGDAHIIDYKTGSLPTKTAVKDGRATQMLVEAALLQQGGFSQIGQKEATKLTYWKLRGRDNPIAEIADVTPSSWDAGEIFSKMLDLLARFENEDMPYHAEPDPRAKPAFSDYRHLARLKEWRTEEADSE